MAPIRFNSPSRLPIHRLHRGGIRRPLAAALALGLLLPLAACDLQYAIMGFSEPVVQVASRNAVVELPFREGPGGLVLINGRINGGGSYDFILDTGAPVSVILDGPGTEALKLDTSKARKLGGDDNPAAPTGVITPGFTFEFGAVKFSDLTAVVIPRKVMPCADRFNALNFQGVIGADIFKRFVVEIDHEQKRVRLHDPAQVPPALAAQLRTGKAAELPLTFRSGHIYTDLKVKLLDAEVPVHVHVDTGKNGSLSLITASKPEIQAPKNGQEVESCYVNGTGKSKRGEPVTVQLANAVARDVPVQFEATDQAKLGKRQGAIGITLMKRYVTWFDYPGKRMVLVERDRSAPALLAGNDVSSEYSQAVLNLPGKSKPGAGSRVSEMPRPPQPPEPPPPPGPPAVSGASRFVDAADPPAPPQPPAPPAPPSAKPALPPTPPIPGFNAPQPPSPPKPPRAPQPTNLPAPPAAPAAPPALSAPIAPPPPEPPLPPVATLQPWT